MLQDNMRLLTNNDTGPIVIYITGKHEASHVDDLCRSVASQASSDFTMYEVMVEDWDSNLTPWPASGIFGGRDFAGEGVNQLKLVEELIRRELGESVISQRPLYIAGYSLAGLFSLWALCESDIFAGAVSCSGSLWYPKWCQYIEGKSFLSDKKVYLSLGDKEPRTKNQVMSTVGDCTTKTYEFLLKNVMVKNVHFEWNEGGHFTDPSKRMAKGIAWIIDN